MKRSTRKILALLFLGTVLSAAWIPFAYGQSGIETEAKIVSASLAPIEQEMLGRSVTVLNRERIEGSHAATLVELLRMVPGVRVVQMGAKGQPVRVYIRGCEPDFTAVALDGIPLDDPFTARFDLAHMTTDNIERVEILRGAAGVAGAFVTAGGLINIITRRGGEKGENDVMLEGGSHTELRGRARTSGEWNGYAYSASLSHARTDGHLPVNSGYDQTTLWARVDRAVGDRGEIGATLWLAGTEREDPYDNGGDQRPPFPLDPDADVEKDYFALALDGNYRLTEWWDVSLRGGALATDEDISDPDNGVANGDPAGGRSEGRTVQREYLRVVNTMPVPYNWRLDWGGEFWHEHDEAVLGGTLQQELSRRSLGAFFELSKGGAGFWENDRWQVLLGSRYDFVTDVKNWQAYSFAGVYWRGKTRLHGTINQGHRPLTVGEMGTASPAFTPDRGIDTPKLFSWEIGVRRAFLDERVELGATAYYCEQENFIETVVGDNGGLTNIHGPEAEVRGLELTAGVKITERLSVEAEWDLEDNEISSAGKPGGAYVPSDMGRTLDRRPESMGSVRVLYETVRTHLEMSAHHYGKAQDKDFSPLDAAPAGSAVQVMNESYTLVNAAAEYRLDDRWTVYARGENILDEEYASAYGFSRPGATGRAGFVFAF